MLKTLADDIELNCPPDGSDTNLLIGIKCHYIEVNPAINPTTWVSRPWY
jgi:hypothetical protein